ncbi:uncharacterized protein B0T15DRAFT_275791 [Chaetomium strumarium]|uniref:AB hydrolase-1 domain-containing protein n=1 Tax=Chaetomium strumarium TaxID=1170767 RepID=A0AAJ0GNY2_9PEZI|nr:hypothetical protein B0T15DRAFT_275791 [Chaetomium strumarium]
MARRTSESMDWDWYQSKPAEVDPMSPFAKITLGRLQAQSTLDSPHESTKHDSSRPRSQKGAPPPRALFGPVLFSTSQKRIDPKADYRSLRRASRMRKSSPSLSPDRHQEPLPKSRALRFLLLPSSSPDLQTESANAGEESGDDSSIINRNVGRPRGRARGRNPEAESTESHDSEYGTERFATYASRIALVSLFFGGNFYYKVVSVSSSLLWAYVVFIFPGKRNGRSGPKPIRSVRGLVVKLVVGFVKVSCFIMLLAWCAMLSPLQIFVPTLMDAWIKYSEHPPFRSFEVLYEPSDPAVDVFAIHGLGSNPSSAWRYVGNGTEVYWLRDLLPQQEGLSRIRVIMVNHQTRWDSHSPEVDFDVVAKMMLDDIEHLHHKHRPIIFIAHSFGGLLLKRSLVLANTVSKHIAEMTRGILFLGVPHYGTRAAFVASILACTAYWRGSSTTMLEYMAEGSLAVHNLDNEFYEAYARPGANRDYTAPYICNFLEMRPEHVGKLSLSPTVNIKSGTLRYAKDVLLDTDHRGLNKFRSSDDPNFEKFLRHFRQAFTWKGHDSRQGASRRWLTGM